MIEIVDHKHISLFYTDKQFQGRGIGKELLRKSLELCFEHNPEVSEISVNSSPNAVTAYQEFRFFAVSPEQTKNGIRFVPMKLELLKDLTNI